MSSYSMHAKFFIITSLLAWRQHSVHAAPTWPAPTDELEDILFLNAGYRSRGFAAPVTPCSKGLSSSRVTGAEWIRTAFHDSISGNVYTGVGGLDGSIAWELDSLENEGVFADDSVAAWAPYVSDLTSLSDVIAAATYAATRSCSNISVAVRGGRADATESGPTGFVPQPQNAISIFRNQFARMGLGDQGMVQFIACGHSIGGVHGPDHPDITDQPLATFDTTPHSIDNSVAVEYVSGVTTNPLVVGRSISARKNSDFRVFSGADNNATIRSLAADPELFANACKTLFEAMINLVPSGTQLSDPITPYEVKPYALQLTLLDGGSKIRFTGDIRVRTTTKSVSQVQLAYVDRSGAAVETPIGTTAKGTASGFDDTFSFFGFSADLPADSSISSFNVIVTYSDSTETFDNNRSGFQVQDTVLYQAPQSCLDSSGKLTVVAAVRDAQAAPNLEVMVKVPQESPNPVPSISTATAAMATQSVVGSYQLYSADFTFAGSQASSALFGVLGDGSSDRRKSPSGLPTACKTLAVSAPDPSTTLSTSLSSTQTSISSNSSSAASTMTTESTSSTPFPTPTSTSDYEFKGCYNDPVVPRGLSGKDTYDENMTVDKCAADCTLYRYFGVEYSKECYCGNAIAESSTQQPLTECNMECAGDAEQMCGASHRLSLYTNLRYSAPVNPEIAGYEYKGCYSEGSSTRALVGSSFNDGNMTVGLCAELCGGTAYFGVEYGRECYCGSALQAGSLPQDAAECNMLCAGNSTQFCGASYRLNLYANTATPPAANPSIANYTYQGCYADSVNARVLSDVYVPDASLTVEKCAAICAEYTYFGTEYGAECYCGEELEGGGTKVGESECGMLCGGDAAQFCGDGYRLSVYRKAGETD